MNELTKENLLVICPNEEKLKILQQISKEEKLYDIKFMTKEEYKNNYYYSYDEKALFYLLNKYKYNLDVAKVYLKNLYVIDELKDYKSPKLNFLKNLKIELKENNLLVENPNFKDYLKSKNIIVTSYYDLEKYEEEILNKKIEIPASILTTPVVECTTLEDEVNYVCLKILTLLESGVDINKIYLTNISNDYYLSLIHI